MDDFDALPDATTSAPADDFDALPSNPQGALLSAAPPLTLTERLRRNLSPLLGPTPLQKMQEGVTMVDGQGNLTRVYKPFGSDVDSAGFFPALSKPTIAIPKATHSADDDIITAAAKATYNTGAGFAEFMESPLGVATLGVGGLGPGAARAVATGYGTDMALKVPDAATAAGTTSVTGTTGQKIEADLGLAVNVGLAGHLLGEGSGIAPAVADKLGANPGGWRPQDLQDGAIGTVDPAKSEFGGAAVAPGDDFDALPEAQQVQTSGFDTANWPGGEGRDDFDALPEKEPDEFDALPGAEALPAVVGAGEVVGDQGIVPPSDAPQGQQLSFEDKLSNWADATIAQGQQRLGAGIDPTVLAAYAVKGALLIKNGIVDFGRWSAEMVREHGEAIRPYLGAVFQQSGGLAQGEGLRQFGQKLQLDPDVPADTKTGVGEYTYTIGNNADAQAAARQIIAAHGVDDAMQLFQNKRASIAPDLRVVLGGELIDQLGQQHRLALSEGDKAGADAALSKQISVADERLRQGTDLAKGLQANKVYGDLSTAGILKQADGMFGDAGANELTRIQPVTDQVREGFRAANDAAVQGTIRDPKVNETARAAVNDHVANSADTNKGVIVEVTGAFAESPEIVRQAREQLRGQLNSILQKRGVDYSKTPADELRKILDDTAKRAAGIAAGHYQGAELGKTLAEKFQERLGLSAREAQRLANAMDREYSKMITAARAKIPQRIATARAKLNAPFDPNEFNQPALDREIARQLKAQNIRLGDLVKQHSAVVDATGRSIGERVVTDAGLKGPRADDLKAAFDKRFAELATAAKQRALKQLESAGVKLPKALKGDKAAELIKLTNLGAFTNDKFSDELAKRLNLPVLTGELKREIARRANALQELPKGFLRDRAAVQLLDYISQQRGLKAWELPMSVWYANVLSHLTTPVHILMDNLPNLAANSVVQMIRNPGALREAPGALVRGAGKGLLQGAEVLKTGVVTGVKSRIAASKVLEQDPFTGLASPLNKLKYVGRVLSAAHVATFKPAYELKQLIVARDVAHNEGLSGSALTQRVADLMGNTEARVNGARAQATAEGLTGLDFRRRVGEIIEQQRDRDIPGIGDRAQQYAQQVTYLNEPYGVIGAVTKGIDAAQRAITGESKTAGIIAQTLIPFKTIVGNLVNEKLNYFPTGAFRAAVALKTGKLYGEPVQPGAVGDLITKSVLGTTALAAATAAISNGMLKLTGNGPSTAEQRRQLHAADGWRPNSIKIGNTYYSYLRTPLAMPLTVLANYQDALKYGNLSKQDVLNRLTYAAMSIPEAIVHQSFFKSMGDVLDALKEPDPAVAVKAVQRLGAQNAAAFVSPGALMDIDRLFDPQQYSANDMAGMVRAQIPWARRENHPVINALGEPVKTGIFSGDFSSAKADPLWSTLAAKQAWVPAMPSTVIVGDKKDGPGNFRALTPDEMYAYTKMSGQAAREELLDNLTDLRTMDPDDAKKYVQKVTAAARKDARSKFTP